MPDIQIAASTPPASATTASATAAAALAAAGDGQAAGAFAALLQQQLADPMAAGIAARPELQLLAATDTTVRSPDLEALLPLLLGAKGLSTAAPLQPTGDGQAKSRIDTEDTAVVAPELLLALPTNVPVLADAAPAAAGQPAASRGGADLQAPLPGTGTGNAAAANDVAILAGAPSVAAANAKDAETFETLLGNRDPQAAVAATGAPHAANAAPSPAVAAAATPIQVETPVGAHGWGQEVGDKVLWMAGRHENRAELVLTPPQLGRIEVSLSVNGDQASAIFTSPNPAVREALESALPRLREVLADAGIQLGQTQVGSEAPGQSAQGRENGDNRPRITTIDTAASVAAGLSAPTTGGASNPWVHAGRGLVDTFA